MPGVVAVAFGWVGGFLGAYLISSLMFHWERKVALSVVLSPCILGLLASSVDFALGEGGESWMYGWFTVSWLLGALVAPVIRASLGDTSREMKPAPKSVGKAAGASFLTFCVALLLVLFVAQPAVQGTV